MIFLKMFWLFKVKKWVWPFCNEKGCWYQGQVIGDIWISCCPKHTIERILKAMVEAEKEAKEFEEIDDAIHNWINDEREDSGEGNCI